MSQNLSFGHTFHCLASLSSQALSWNGKVVTNFHLFHTITSNEKEALFLLINKKKFFKNLFHREFRDVCPSMNKISIFPMPELCL